MEKEKKSSALNLFNRYGEKIWLHYMYNEGTNEVYSLEGYLDYARYIYEDLNMTIIGAIDPSGGPYMSIDNFKIKNDTMVLSNISEINSGKILMTFKKV